MWRKKIADQPSGKPTEPRKPNDRCGELRVIVKVDDIVAESSTIKIMINWGG
jgi:hypothetical protein